jgi:hypothetical protein
MNNAVSILASAAFRRWPLPQSRRGPINRAVFESQAIALSPYTPAELRPFKEDILTGFRRLFSDSDYLRSVTVGTGDPRAVSTRLTKTKNIIKEILS